ncbi:HVA1 family protein, partial [Maribacter dokdonensis]
MIRKGTVVKWAWGNDTAEGTVEETYTSKTTKTIKGNEVTRNGS